MASSSPAVTSEVTSEVRSKAQAASSEVPKDDEDLTNSE